MVGSKVVEKNHDFEYCLRNTTLFSQGMHRNKLVKELLGSYSRIEQGGCLGELMGSQDQLKSASSNLYPPMPPVEASQDDLEVSKLVLARFLPPVVIDTSDLIEGALRNLSSHLNLSEVSSGWKDHAVAAKPPMTNSAQQWIESHNDLDIKLYEYALTLVGL